MNMFEIDFFEFSFLVEACLPPGPIARSMFFNNVSEKYYHQMTHDQRCRLHEWVSKHSSYDLDNEDIAHFDVRFDQTNQYEVHIKINGESDKVLAYKYNNRYHKSKSTSILDEYIVDVKRIIY